MQVQMAASMGQHLDNDNEQGGRTRLSSLQAKISKLISLHIALQALWNHASPSERPSGKMSLTASRSVAYGALQRITSLRAGDIGIHIRMERIQSTCGLDIFQWDTAWEPDPALPLLALTMAISRNLSENNRCHSSIHP